MIKRIYMIILTLCMASYLSISQIRVYSQAQSETISIESIIENMSAKEMVVTEMTTGKVLYQKKMSDRFCAGHLTKLMTLLLVAQHLDSGEIKLTDKFTVSDYANSQKAPQIWLDKNEKITIEELIKSITVGNANDAAVTLAEGMANDEKKFVKDMNAECIILGMKNTSFADCTGISEYNLTTAADMSKLCAELQKYESLKPYLTTWLDHVRNDSVELVNSNRLVRTYKGISGMKACGGQYSGNCICATAVRGNMKVCVVIAGCENEENSYAEAKQLLDLSFDSYQLFEPEIPDELLTDISVTGGEKMTCKVKIEKIPSVVVSRGSVSLCTTQIKKEQLLKAPVNKNEICGSLTVECDGKKLCSVNLVTAQRIDTVDWWCGMSKILYNLLNIK